MATNHFCSELSTVAQRLWGSSLTSSGFFYIFYFFFPIKLVEIPIAASFKKAAAKASRTASMRRRQTRGLRHRRRPRQLLQCRRMMMLDGCTGGCLLGSPFILRHTLQKRDTSGPIKKCGLPYAIFSGLFSSHCENGHIILGGLCSKQEMQRAKRRKHFKYVFMCIVELQ